MFERLRNVKVVHIMFTWLPQQLLKGEVLFGNIHKISAENSNYSSCYQIHSLKDNIMNLFSKQPCYCSFQK